MSDEEKSKENTEAQTEEVKEPEQSPGTKSTEKTLTQSEVNKLLADERRKHDAKYRDLQTEYTGYKSSIEAKEQAANDAAAEQVEALRKDLPDAIVKLLDKLTPIEQLEWLRDPENAITKKQIPELPTSAEGHGKQRKSINVV